MFPINHKTIFVLDHTPYFGISSDFPIDFDVPKNRGYLPVPPICKSLWTCSVEAAVEYCRIVWDLFPEGKLVRFVVSDNTAHMLNTWAVAQQNLTHLLNGLCLVGPVRRGAGGDVEGLVAAIEALAEPSPDQSSRPAERHFQNRGRVICITSARDNDSIKNLKDIAHNTIVQINKKAALAQPASTSESTSTTPQKGGGRSASHVLAAQGGELWIGALGGRTPYDDPPALSEGAGGRVTDYRIKEFGALMQQNRLHPLRGSGANARARARLQRHTTYWPLTISSTLIFNLGSVLEPLTRLVVQETLTDEEVETCRNVLLSLLGMESRHEFPTAQLPSNMRGKSSGRREEQWRQVWGELEALVRAHAAAPQHRALLRVLLDCRAHNNHPSDGMYSFNNYDTFLRPLVIHYCHIVIINVTPENAETRVTNQPLTEIAGGQIGVEVIVSRASALANLLGRLVLPHYKLATTTVTGIPMKEEQNASSSANYDVEIIHAADAHAGLRASQTPAEALESVVLRWWTPRGAEGGAGGCCGALWRVTPADVASRPSACLVNFLLNGRSVTLEVPSPLSPVGAGNGASTSGDVWAPRNVLDALLGAPRPPRRPDFAGRMAAGSRVATLYPQLQQDVETSH
ncbi:hypothetical protein B5X24_HaOG208841 [Helicoverpa armigera]|nr:hypothetical protein B5X24_HaOG208841 [Helicoverpa armigera]